MLIFPQGVMSSSKGILGQSLQRNEEHNQRKHPFWVCFPPKRLQLSLREAFVSYS